MIVLERHLRKALSVEREREREKDCRAKTKRARDCAIGEVEHSGG